MFSEIDAFRDDSLAHDQEQNSGKGDQCWAALQKPVDNLRTNYTSPLRLTILCEANRFECLHSVSRESSLLFADVIRTAAACIVTVDWTRYLSGNLVGVLGLFKCAE